MYRKTVLENGVRVVTEAMPRVRSLSIGLLVDTGPRDEPPGLAGVAHLAEHLMFQGTSSRSAEEIARFIDVAGGEMGGFTSRDYTCYYASVLDDHGTYALDLLGDVLLNSTFPEKSLSRQKSAIACEIQESRDAAERHVSALLKASAWPGHHLGRAVQGSLASVARVTREDLIYFVHRNYAPDRLVIAAAGHVDHDDFVAQARDAFWRMLGESGDPPVLEPRFRPGPTAIEAPHAQAYFSIGLPAPAYADHSRYGWHVLSQLIGAGVSSRLFREIREERGLAYSINSEYLAFREAGLFQIDGCTPVGSLPEVLAITFRILASLTAGESPVDDEELWRARTRLRGRHLMASEDAGTRMSRLATQELYFGRQVDEEEVLAGIDAFDAAGLDHVVQGAFRNALGQAAVAVVGPGLDRSVLDSIGDAIQIPMIVVGDDID